MPVGLGEQALAGIYQQHSRVGRGSAGRHVAGVLLVPGSIGNDETALGGGKKTIRNIDGDALLAFGLQAVDQEGEIDRFTLRAVPARVLLQ